MEEIEKLKADNAELKAKNKTLETDLGAANKKVATLTTEADNLKGEVATHKGNLEVATKTIAFQKAELLGADEVITDLKGQLEKAEKVSAATGYPVVKDKAGKTVEVLVPEFMFPKRGLITLEILKKDADLVSLLLDRGSDNVRLKA